MNAKLPLKTLVLLYIKGKYPEFVHKGELGRKAVNEWGYENENMGRRCRELYHEGFLERRINNRKCVEYRFVPEFEPKVEPTAQEKTEAILRDPNRLRLFLQ